MVGMLIIAPSVKVNICILVFDTDYVTWEMSHLRFYRFQKKKKKRKTENSPLDFDLVEFMVLDSLLELQ